MYDSVDTLKTSQAQRSKVEAQQWYVQLLCIAHDMGFITHCIVGFRLQCLFVQSMLNTACICVYLGVFAFAEQSCLGVGQVHVHTDRIYLFKVLLASILSQPMHE